MSNVVEFPGETRLDMDPGRVLEAAAETDLKNVVIIGVETDGSLYMSASCAGVDKMIWLMELAKHVLLKNQCDD